MKSLLLIYLISLILHLPFLYLIQYFCSHIALLGNSKRSPHCLLDLVRAVRGTYAQRRLRICQISTNSTARTRQVNFFLQSQSGWNLNIIAGLPSVTLLTGSVANCSTVMVLCEIVDEGEDQSSSNNTWNSNASPWGIINIFLLRDSWHLACPDRSFVSKHKLSLNFLLFILNRKTFDPAIGSWVLV